MTKQYGFYFDASVCSGCKACMTACKDKNNLPVGMNWRKVTEYGGGSWVPAAAHPDLYIANNVYSYAVSTACMHCQNPACLAACPTGAIYKRDDGVVLIDQTKCVGCRYCEWACPYGAPQFSAETGVMTKCNMCQDLMAQGQNPACVDACVMRALQVGELDALRAQYGTVNAIEPLPVADYTQPSLVLTPHRNAQPSGQGTGHIQGLPEEV